MMLENKNPNSPKIEFKRVKGDLVITVYQHDNSKLVEQTVTKDSFLKFLNANYQPQITAKLI